MNFLSSIGFDRFNLRYWIGQIEPFVKYWIRLNLSSSIGSLTIDQGKFSFQYLQVLDWTQSQFKYWMSFNTFKYWISFNTSTSIDLRLND